MRYVAALTVYLALALPAHTQQIQVPPDKQKAFQKVVMRLAFADGCNKRLDRPEIFKDATAAFLRFAQSIELPDAEGRTATIAKTLADRPQEKETSSFSLFNEKLCGDLAASLKSELSQ
ncbi:hypothetical protein [Rhizobium sp. Root1204]|uniref:hypothetical protein n=1 Tax=Rhizobium sp. Root1204 TaxID=1736428 RepID=UPI0007136913|nr:hypothetical protein [Rhizobium sp. Root1204]KQV31148.1 hypothetical protein ASC96_08125 [Rhizobium sp. Root1204]